jgi:hypothetical protein
MATDAQGAINAQTYSWDETARSGKGHKSGDGYIANFNDGGKSSDELAVVSAINTHIGKYTDVLNWNDEAGEGDL